VVVSTGPDLSRVLLGRYAHITSKPLEDSTISFEAQLISNSDCKTAHLKLEGLHSYKSRLFAMYSWNRNHIQHH